LDRFPLSVGTRMRVPAALFVLVSFLLAACSSVQTQRNPKADLSAFKRYYVEHRLTDDHHLDEIIVAELKSLGCEASAGPLTMMPQSTEVLVNYTDTWAWDFKSYLYQLDIQLRDARKDRGLGVGSYRQPTVITKTPAEVVHLIVAPLFKRP
jgi:hypothetical protein